MLPLNVFEVQSVGVLVAPTGVLVAVLVRVLVGGTAVLVGEGVGHEPTAL
jgi:hypothetical protein